MGRNHFEFRAAFVADDCQSMCSKIDQVLRGERRLSKAQSQPRIAFACGHSERFSDEVFTYLMREYASFNATWDGCYRELAPKGAAGSPAQRRGSLGDGSIFVGQMPWLARGRLGAYRRTPSLPRELAS